VDLIKFLDQNPKIFITTKNLRMVGYRAVGKKQCIPDGFEIIIPPQILTNKEDLSISEQLALKSWNKRYIKLPPGSYRVENVVI